MKNKLLLLAFTLVAIAAGAQQTANKTFRINNDLEVIQLTPKTYLYVSWVTMAPYGRFSDNGLIYVMDKYAVFLDTPMNDSISNVLLNWFSKKFPGVQVGAVIVHHFHDDCLGGLRAFHKRGVASLANDMTIEALKSDSVEKPRQPINGGIVLVYPNNDTVICQYFGEAHTKDNIVTWLPTEKILFGGCMIKALGAGKGNVADANLAQWSATVRKVRQRFRKAKIVVPGHGKHGGKELLDYTIKLFEKDAK